MGAQLKVPGRVAPLDVPAPAWAAGYPPPVRRSVYAAAHVAALPDGSIDWDSTLRFREQLWRHGFGLAEAMDTAQRGTGLTFGQARELISRSSARAAELGTRIVSGAGTDQLAAGAHALSAIVDAYAEQVEFVQAAGSQVIVMASRALAASARSADDYLEVYRQVLTTAHRPVLLHWLGPAFDPALRAYWGSEDLAAATDTVVQLIERADGKVAGIKLSVLDAKHERAMRRRLPHGVRLYTGDDLNYAELIRGDTDGGHSDALLGAFAAITAPAAAALHALDRGDPAGYDAAMGPTVALSRLIFAAPTYDYKVGVAFLAWLNGFQPHFAMLAGQQERRSAEHLIGVFELAAAAGALRDPELAVDRMSEYLASATPAGLPGAT
jgi:dihydrodipicolinate synthase/N-acetylneuraminate lyase